jgi:c-di-GMP-related signal transduction protein
VTRHPIFDTRKEVYGYRLVFRHGFDEYYHDLAEQDSEKATVDFMAMVNFGELTGSKRGFVALPEHLLLDAFYTHLPRLKLTVCLDSALTRTEAIAAAVEAMRAEHYQIALENFTAEHLDSPLLDSARMVMVDFLEVPIEQRQDIIGALKDRRIEAIATNVETQPEYDLAMSLGFRYALGDFFSRPVIDPQRDINTSKLACFRMIHQVNQAELSYDEIAEIIKQDVSLTYKLLRFINSAWFGLKYEISSVKHALVLLGSKEIRRWASLVMMTESGNEKPRELLLLSLSRARAAELIGLQANMQKQAPELFLMGMFSIIDALVDVPLADALEELPLAEPIRDALLGGVGPYSHVLQIVLEYEKGNWDALAAATKPLGIDEQALPDIFRDSLQWARHALIEARI